MNIEIAVYNDVYRADCLDLPGTPPVGTGETEAEAVASLFQNLLLGDVVQDTTGLIRI